MLALARLNEAVHNQMPQRPRTRAVSGPTTTRQVPEKLSMGSLSYCSTENAATCKLMPTLRRTVMRLAEEG